VLREHFICAFLASVRCRRGAASGHLASGKRHAHSARNATPTTRGSTCTPERRWRPPGGSGRTYRHVNAAAPSINAGTAKGAGYVGARYGARAFRPPRLLPANACAGTDRWPSIPASEPLIRPAPHYRTPPHTTPAEDVPYHGRVRATLANGTTAGTDKATFQPAPSGEGHRVAIADWHRALARRASCNPAAHPPPITSHARVSSVCHTTSRALQRNCHYTATVPRAPIPVRVSWCATSRFVELSATPHGRMR